MSSKEVVRNWLLRKPNPHSLRLSSADVPVAQELRCAGRRSWSKVADSIIAIGPELIEALDKDGNLIRALRPDQETTATNAPTIPSALITDPETARISHFATLLHRAYEHSTTVAFAKMVELVEKFEERSASIEARLEKTEAAHRRAMEDRLDDAWDRLEEREQQAEEKKGEQSIEEQMMGAFMSGKHQAAVPNGKGKSS